MQGTAVVQYAYDNANRRTTLTLPNGVVTEYGYDAASQLTGLTYKLGGTTLGGLAYTYDAAGRRAVVGGTWARTGLPAAVNSATYNANNQQTAFGGATLTYDLTGNLTGDGTNSYTWDSRNRLTAVTGPTNASFVYDAMGRRRSKTFAGTATSVLHDGLNPVQEQTGSETVNLLTGLGIDEYFSRTDANGTMSLLTDALSSTVALTDNAGAVQTSYTYEALGATAVTGAVTQNVFDYTGRESDAAGLKYYRARFYHPSLQRFIAEDSIRFAGGDTNLYAYVRGQPLASGDPLGLISPLAGMAVGALLGATSGAQSSHPIVAAVLGANMGITFGVLIPVVPVGIPGAIIGAAAGAATGAVIGALEGDSTAMLKAATLGAVGGAIGGFWGGGTGAMLGTMAGLALGRADFSIPAEIIVSVPRANGSETDHTTRRPPSLAGRKN
jgi:RHS repeat-associated protein